MKSRTLISMPSACAIVLALSSTLVHAWVPALPPCTASGQLVTLSLNTGSVGPNPPPGVVDPIWHFPHTADLFSTKKHPQWVSPPLGSRWIQPSKIGTPQIFPPATSYLYVTEFTTGPLSSYSPNSLVINGFYSADDQALVQLNFGPTIAACSNCFPTLHTLPTVHITTVFNTLSINVWNNMTYSALLVRATVRAVCL